jgi:DNA-directed RNA polymerase
MAKKKAPCIELWMSQVRKWWSIESKRNLSYTEYNIMGKKFKTFMTKDYKYTFNMNVKTQKQNRTILCNYTVKLHEHDKYSKALSANLIHSIDGLKSDYIVYHFHHRSGGKVVSPAHDKWHVHPNYTDLLREIEQEFNVLLYKADILREIASRFGCKPEYIGDLKPEDINGKYSIS